MNEFIKVIKLPTVFLTENNEQRKRITPFFSEFKENLVNQLNPIFEMLILPH